MRIVCVALGFVLIATVTLAVADEADVQRWKNEMKQPLLSERDGKYYYENFELCELEPQPGYPPRSKKMQFQTLAEAPADGSISRDGVVAFVVATKMKLRSGIASVGYRLKCRSLSAPIGELDVVIALVLTTEGFQVQITDRVNDKNWRETRTWADVYAER